ncbi:MAG: hypothetical protein IIU14_03650 [Ruminococcus sp.]|nr:hypothetical protein [Ruminococcus sp.]
MNYTRGWKLKTSEWIADHSRLKTAVYDEDSNTCYVNTADTVYTNDFKGAYDFCADWMISRAAWLSSKLVDNVKTVKVDNTPSEEPTPQETTEIPKETTETPGETTGIPQKATESNTQKNIESSVKLKAGEKLKLMTADSKATGWKTSNAKAVTVKNGTVTGLKKGSAIISATLSGGGRLKVSVKVTTSPRLSKKSVTVRKGKTVRVSITGKASNVKNTYKNTKIAEITSKKSAATLTVRGRKRGKTSLKIIVNGVTLRLKVKVK